MGIISDVDSSTVPLPTTACQVHSYNTRPILDLCKEMLQRPGAWVASRWLDKEVLDLLGARAEAAEAEANGEGGRGRVEGR